MSLIQVFIATHNRPSVVLNAIHSALNQDFDSFEVIVSDNSTNDETEVLISKIEDKRLSYKKRNPSLSALDHFNAILKEVTSDYFIIFHDDDVMHKIMLSELYYAFTKHENIAAVGANAMIVRDGKKTNKKIFKTSTKNIILSHPKDIVFQYATRGGIVPFPSYMYKSEKIKNLKVDLLKGGKYCDAAFILDILSLGKIIFLVNPLMDYHIHKSQDSHQFSFQQESKLILYFCTKTGLSRKSKLIKRLRIKCIYLELKQEIQTGGISLLSKKYLILLNLLFKMSFFEFLPRILIISLKLCFQNRSTTKIKITHNVTS